jgi:MFS family permease
MNPTAGATGTGPGTGLRLGLRENLAQFSLLVAVNALVGGMIGQERTVLPLLAEQEFGLTALTAALTFIAAFGVVKAATNFFAGTLSDRYGRKPVLVAGWLIGIPVPLLLMWAPSWEWVIAANVLLGVNQGLTWSTTVIMKIDLVGPERRGFAMGLNEAAGYGAVAITALATGYIAQEAFAPSPSISGSCTPVSGSACRSCSSARPAATPTWRPPCTSPVTTATTTVSRPARCSGSRASGRRHSRRAVRPVWSTTSTTASRGASSRSPSRRPG